MTLVRVSCLNPLHNQTALQPELFRASWSRWGVECSGTQDSRFYPYEPATVTSVIPLILLICPGEPRGLACFSPCSFVVLKFGQDIKSNANRAHLGR